MRCEFSKRSTLKTLPVNPYRNIDEKPPRMLLLRAVSAVQEQIVHITIVLPFGRWLRSALEERPVHQTIVNVRRQEHIHLIRSAQLERITASVCRLWCRLIADERQRCTRGIRVAVRRMLGG